MSVIEEYIQDHPSLTLMVQRPKTEWPAFLLKMVSPTRGHCPIQQMPTIQNNGRLFVIVNTVLYASLSSAEIRSVFFTAEELRHSGSFISTNQDSLFQLENRISHFTFALTPGHVSIRGNEEADVVGESAVDRPEIDAIPIRPDDAMNAVIKSAAVMRYASGSETERRAVANNRAAQST